MTFSNQKSYFQGKKSCFQAGVGCVKKLYFQAKKSGFQSKISPKMPEKIVFSSHKSMFLIKKCPRNDVFELKNRIFRGNSRVFSQKSALNSGSLVKKFHRNQVFEPKIAFSGQKIGVLIKNQPKMPEKIVFSSKVKKYPEIRADTF